MAMNWANLCTTAAPVSTASLLDKVRQTVEQIKKERFLGMEVVESKYFPKTMKDKDGVEREVLAVLATPQPLPLSMEAMREAMQAQRIVIMLGDPVAAGGPATLEHGTSPTQHPDLGRG